MTLGLGCISRARIPALRPCCGGREGAGVSVKGSVGGTRAEVGVRLVQLEPDNILLRVGVPPPQAAHGGVEPAGILGVTREGSAV